MLPPVLLPVLEDDAELIADVNVLVPETELLGEIAVLDVALLAAVDARVEVNGRLLDASEIAAYICKALGPPQY